MLGLTEILPPPPWLRVPELEPLDTSGHQAKNKPMLFVELVIRPDSSTFRVSHCWVTRWAEFQRTYGGGYLFLWKGGQSTYGGISSFRSACVLVSLVAQGVLILSAQVVPTISTLLDGSLSCPVYNHQPKVPQDEKPNMHCTGDMYTSS